MPKRKTKKKDSKGLLYLILLVCAAFIGRLRPAEQCLAIGAHQLRPPAAGYKVCHTDRQV